MGKVEPFPSSSQRLSLVSALLQETHSFPGGAETVFGLLCSCPGCVSVPWLCFFLGLAQLSLPSAGEVLEMWMQEGATLSWTGDLPQGPPSLLGLACACAGSAWGGTRCQPPRHHLPEVMSGANKWEHYRYPHWLCKQEGTGWPALPQP